MYSVIPEEVLLFFKPCYFAHAVSHQESSPISLCIKILSALA